MPKSIKLTAFNKKHQANIDTHRWRFLRRVFLDVLPYSSDEDLLFDYQCYVCGCIIWTTVDKKGAEFPEYENAKLTCNEMLMKDILE